MLGSSLLSPCGTMKLNFDVAIKDDFVVTVAVLSNNKNVILLAFIKKLNSLNVNKGEAMAALTEMDLILSNDCSKLMLEAKVTIWLQLWLSISHLFS
jgi:hypothetical protein